jgi:plasmid replication initiation protein
LELFRALPGPTAVRDVQDIMTYPFFSLGKSKRIAPIAFRSGDVRVHVEGTVEHGIASIWDADVLIWTTSQLVQARDAGVPTSRRIGATPREILMFIRRGTSARDYDRLKAALDRLQSTSVSTSIRQGASRRLHRFSWINEWKELAIIPDWFYAAITDSSKILTIDPAYFELTGGIERWLYRLVRKHAGAQPQGWRFDVPFLHRKSGSLARLSDFALDLRRIAERQSLPGYRIGLVRSSAVESLLFHPRAGQGTV